MRLPLIPNFLVLLFLVGAVVFLGILLATPRLRSVGLGILAGLLIAGFGLLGAARFLGQAGDPSLLHFDSAPTTAEQADAEGIPALAVTPAPERLATRFEQGRDFSREDASRAVVARGAEYSVGLVVLGFLAVVACLGLVLLIARPTTRTFGIVLAVMVAGPLAFLATWMFAYRTVSFQPAAAGAASLRPLLAQTSPLRLGRVEAPGIAIALPAESGRPPEPPPEALAGPPVARPDWVEQPSGLQHNTYQIVLASDPRETLDECAVDLQQKLLVSLNDYAAERFGAASVRQLNLGASLPELWQALYVDHWVQPYRSQTQGLPEMQIVHVLLQIDSQVRGRLEEAWQWCVRKDRLGYTCGIAVLLVSILGTLFGYLRLDTATQGYYSRRLQAAALAVILALVGAGFLLLGNAFQGTS